VVTCEVQLATSVALAAVTCLGSVPPEAPEPVVTLMVVLGVGWQATPDKDHPTKTSGCLRRHSRWPLR